MYNSSADRNILTSHMCSGSQSRYTIYLPKSQTKMFELALKEQCVKYNRFVAT